MADDLFSGDDEPTITPYEDLVGEGKKYHDNEAVAKAIAEKDRFITRLLDEKKEVTEAFQKRIKEEEFLTRMEQLTSRANLPDTQDTPAPNGNEQATLTPEAVNKLLDEREAAEKRTTNLNAAVKTLKETFGDDYKRRVAQQAQTLGVTTEYLTNVAAQSPEAFYRMVGLDNKPAVRDEFAPPRSSVTLSTTPTSTKNFAYFAEQRKKNGEAWYFSADVQREVWRELNAQGEANFYKR